MEEHIDNSHLNGSLNGSVVPQVAQTLRYRTLPYLHRYGHPSFQLFELPCSSITANWEAKIYKMHDDLEACTRKPYHRPHAILYLLETACDSTSA